MARLKAIGLPTGVRSMLDTEESVRSFPPDRDCGERYAEPSDPDGVPVDLYAPL